MRYSRDISKSSYLGGESKTVRTLDGADLLYVKFEDRVEWLDYWATDVRFIPLKKVQGMANTVSHRYVGLGIHIYKHISSYIYSYTHLYSYLHS